MKKLIKRILREEVEDDFDWIRSVPGEIPEIDDENKFLVLVNILGIDEVFGDVVGFDDPDTDFEQNSWSHYGLETFTLNNGDVWAVGDEGEFGEALYEYWYNFVDDAGIDSVYNFEEYLIMSDTDRRLFAQDVADNYVLDLSDEDVVEYAGYDDEWQELEELLEELEDQRDGIDTSIDDQISDLENKKDDLINRSREIVSSSEYDTWYECLEDPYHCLVNEHGWYMGAQDLINSGNVYFDQEEFARIMSNEANYGELSSYDGDYYVEGDYIAIRIE